MPIADKTTSYTDGSSYYERTIQPLKVSFSMTIHKSQSLTLPMAIIDLGSKEKPFSLSYVSLSRPRSLEDLVLVHCGVARFEKIKMPPEIRIYLATTALLVQRTLQIYAHLVDWYVNIYISLILINLITLLILDIGIIFYFFF